MRFGSTAKVLLKCKLKYYRISECHQSWWNTEPCVGKKQECCYLQSDTWWSPHMISMQVLQCFLTL